MTDIHSCSYYCDRPACIKAQRDELRDKLLFKTDLVERLRGIKRTPRHAEDLCKEAADEIERYEKEDAIKAVANATLLEEVKRLAARVAELEGKYAALLESDHPELVLSQINADLRARVAELEADGSASRTRPG